jgi:hypothetical protein
MNEEYFKRALNEELAEGKFCYKTGKQLSTSTQNQECFDQIQ